MAAACLSAKAQYIYERSLIGEWDLYESSGYNDAVPLRITFRDDGTCTYTDWRGTLECAGYIISDMSQTIHLFSGTNFNGNPVMTMVNMMLVPGIEWASDFSYVTLKAFDGTSWWVKMERKVSPSGVRSAQAGQHDGKKYDLRGVETKHPSGVYIQDGNKKVGR